VYIKKASPNVNGNVDRSQRRQEFHPLVEYTNHIDILKKLEQWEAFYNCHRLTQSEGKHLIELLKKSLLLLKAIG
jgi:hypothetical protein